MSKTGEVSYNNNGDKMIIYRYRKYNDIDVYFPEYNWERKNTTYFRFLSGSIKCPYHKNIYNTGYIGEGLYITKENGVQKESYKTWFRMIRRCYDPYTLNTDKHRKYRDVTVCEEWHNFQNFAKWYEENYYEVDGERTELDKDILVKGNKIYSPETCIFVPHSINSLFIKCDKVRGNLPIGVTMVNTKNGIKYRSRFNHFGKEILIGKFDSAEEAFSAYKIAKENHIKQIAKKYKNVIPKRLHCAILRYKIESMD